GPRPLSRSLAVTACSQKRRWAASISASVEHDPWSRPLESTAKIRKVLEQAFTVEGLGPQYLDSRGQVHRCRRVLLSPGGGFVSRAGVTVDALLRGTPRRRVVSSLGSSPCSNAALGSSLSLPPDTFDSSAGIPGVAHRASMSMPEPGGRHARAGGLMLPRPG